MLDDSLKRLIERELQEISALLERSAEMLKALPGVEPPFERLAGLSQVLISFYTGLERIFERIVRRVDGSLPAGQRWHTDLLLRVSLTLPSGWQSFPKGRDCPCGNTWPFGIAHATPTPTIFSGLPWSLWLSS